MKFLANENFPKPSVNLLRQNGKDVLYISEFHPGIDDEKVVELASIEKRIILTFDKDYGEIIFRYNKLNPPSVIFFRTKGPDPLEAAENLLLVIKENLFSFENHFTVIANDSIRQRKYTI
jgi:predicted nuclease of predicted toxin-antitoxin system